MISETVRHYIYFVVVLGIFLGLGFYVYYLWGNKTRGRRIERRGEILFSDEPLEVREDKK